MVHDPRIPTEACRNSPGLPPALEQALPPPGAGEECNLEARLVYHASTMSTATSGPRCPRCRNELTQAQASDVKMCVCDLCGGVWLDNQGTSRIIAALHTDAVRIAKEAAQAAFASAPTEQIINCPICASPMERISAGETSVIVDRCAQHGTWFDRHELFMASNLAEQQRQASGVVSTPTPSAPAPSAATSPAAPVSAPRPGAPRPGGPPRPGQGQASGDAVRKILR